MYPTKYCPHGPQKSPCSLCIKVEKTVGDHEPLGTRVRTVRGARGGEVEGGVVSDGDGLILRNAGIGIERNVEP